MTIVDLMDLGKKYNFDGTYSDGKEKYKFVGGVMYLYETLLKEWIRASVSSHWLRYTFTVENLERRIGGF